jgi:hypothetical protein
MVWITDYASRVPAARAWEVNGDSSRALIEREAKEELATLKGLLDDPDIKRIAGAELHAKLVNEFKFLSRWYIEFMKQR